MKANCQYLNTRTQGWHYGYLVKRGRKWAIVEELSERWKKVNGKLVNQGRRRRRMPASLVRDVT